MVNQAAEKLGLKDGDFAEIFNDLGTIKIHIKYSTMIRPGVAYYFHAWDPTQFPNHESYRDIVRGRSCTPQPAQSRQPGA